MFPKASILLPPVRRLVPPEAVDLRTDLVVEAAVRLIGRGGGSLEPSAAFSASGGGTKYGIFPRIQSYLNDRLAI